MEELGALFIASTGIASVSGLAHYIEHASANGSLDRNSAVGLRTRVTKSSDSAWEAGHKAAGPWLLACAYTGYISIALAIVSAVFMAAGESLGPGVMILPAFGFIAISFILSVATLIAHRSGKKALHGQ